MVIAIAGSNGYVGKKLISHYKKIGYKVKPISRQMLYGKIEYLSSLLRDTDAVINLAGAPILQLWNAKNKDVIYKSRVLTTQNLVASINFIPDNSKPKTFISASAVGIYGTYGIHTENSQDLNNGFLGDVVKDWENASVDLSDRVRRVIFRLGVVLGKESQTMKKMLPIFNLGLGGKMGDGKQAFPFIHIDDLIQVFSESLTDEKYNGAFNLVAPENVTNGEFTRIFASILNKPAPFTIPSIVLKAVFGKASEMLLKGQFVLPERLLSIQFKYKFENIDDCLRDIIQ